MNQNPNQPVSLPDGGTPEDPKAAALIARRRLLRGGLGIAPVLLASAPRSVMATGGNCVPASSFTSLNASGPEQWKTCSGHKPYYWKTCDKTYWPANCATSVGFDTLFGGGRYPNKTMLNMLDLGETGQDGLAKHCVAALLNARKGMTPTSVLDETKIKDVWNSCANQSYYTPTAGVQWGPDSCIVWLKSTMPL